MARFVTLLFVVLVLSSTGCLGRWTGPERVAQPKRDNRPLPAAAPGTPEKNAVPAGPSWHEGVLGGYLILPGGQADINAERIIGDWPDGSTVVIYDRVRDGSLREEEQWQRVVDFEREWKRRKEKMGQ